MTTINYPEDFLKQSELFNSIKAKHDEDGAGSVLATFLSEQGIDLTADLAATDKAIRKNKQFEKADNSIEALIKEADEIIESVIKTLSVVHQFLEKLYDGNKEELSKWGITYTNDEIVYPSDLLYSAQLFDNCWKKYDSYIPGTSPLKPCLAENGIDMFKERKKVNAAIAKNNLAMQNVIEAKENSEERDKLFNPVMKHLYSIGEYLCEKDPGQLNKWGFV